MVIYFTARIFKQRIQNCHPTVCTKNSKKSLPYYILFFLPEQLEKILFTKMKQQYQSVQKSQLPNSYTNIHWRRTGLNSVGASISKPSGRGRKRGTFISIISGRGRKTVGASAPIASISSAPLQMTTSRAKLLGKKNWG